MDSMDRIVVKNTFLDVPPDVDPELSSSMKRSLSESDLYKKHQVTFIQEHVMAKTKSDASTASISIPSPDPSAMSWPVEPLGRSGFSQCEQTSRKFSPTERSIRSQTGEQMPSVMQNFTPPPTTRPSKRLPFSVGTAGHPTSCGEPCKYVKRKAGCRDGSQCLKCHKCHWSRLIGGVPGLLQEENSEELEATSVGTLGHPHSCGEACKYFKRKGGCMYGTECKSCHKCHWQRPKPKPSGASTEEECRHSIGAVPSVMYTSVLESAPVEVQQSGSTGSLPFEHPFGGSDTLGSSCRHLLMSKASRSDVHGTSARVAKAQSRGRPAAPMKQVRSDGPQLDSRSRPGPSFPQFQDSAQWFKKSHSHLMQRGVHVSPAGECQRDMGVNVSPAGDC